MPTRLDHVHVFCYDADESLRFYTDTLGGRSVPMGKAAFLPIDNASARVGGDEYMGDSCRITFGDGKEGAIHLYRQPPLDDANTGGHIAENFFDHHWTMRCNDLPALEQRLVEEGHTFEVVASEAGTGMAGRVIQVVAPEGTVLWVS